MESALKVFQARISAADPRRIIGRGYALVLDGNGRIAKGVEGFSKGDRLSLMFNDGKLDCLIENVR
jgi:exonuclease VII large subunit